MRNVIYMSLKLLSLPQNCKNHPAAEGSAPSVIRLSSNNLFSTELELDDFCANNIFSWFKPPLSEQNPGCASGRIHSCRQIFQAIIPAACETN